nr:hypothetical protein [Phyllobacterium endophyticum]
MLFHNALRHGGSYTDLGAYYPEERYRKRVIRNLRRRVKALDFLLQEIAAHARAGAVS